MTWRRGMSSRYEIHSAAIRFGSSFTALGVTDSFTVWARTGAMMGGDRSRRELGAHRWVTSSRFRLDRKHRWAILRKLLGEEPVGHVLFAVGLVPGVVAHAGVLVVFDLRSAGGLDGFDHVAGALDGNGGVRVAVKDPHRDVLQ